MTAKELKAQGIVELSGRIGDDVYLFSPDRLDKLLFQICKEQREICGTNLDTDDPCYDDCINAPKPEL